VRYFNSISLQPLLLISRICHIAQQKAKKLKRWESSLSLTLPASKEDSTLHFLRFYLESIVNCSIALYHSLIIT